MKYVEPPHPRQEPRFAGDLTGEHIRFLFRDCVDFGEREVLIGGTRRSGRGYFSSRAKCGENG